MYHFRGNHYDCMIHTTSIKHTKSLHQAREVFVGNGSPKVLYPNKARCIGE